ncbi:MAG: 16S rRNA (guanine(527)-N(7))-methyltransferase RsmG [Desulfobacterales bacterium]
MKFSSEKWKSIVLEGAKTVGIEISPQQAEMMAVHADELIRWNKKTNLTTITKPVDVAVKHFIDSIVPSLQISRKAFLIDIGSGGGFPGIPLKVILPELTVTLVDSSRKKVNFMKQVIRLLNMDDIDAVHGRIEEIALDSFFTGAFDVAISRAFTDLNRFVDLATPLLRKDGKIIAMKSKNTDTELESFAHRGREPVVEAYSLPFQDAMRTLIIV